MVILLPAAANARFGTATAPPIAVSDPSGRAIPAHLCPPVWWWWVSEAVVLPWSLVGVDPGRWDELGVAVAGETDGPTLHVDLGVPVAAEQRAVGQVGAAAFAPFPVVV